MADDHRLSPDELLRDAREAFDEGTDFTVAVEEEFALLDPASLDLVNRFEEVKAAAQGTPLEPNLVGRADRLRGGGEDRPLRDVRRDPRRARGAARSAPGARRAARAGARRHRHAPLGAVAGAADHRHAALPAERRDPPLRRLAQQQLRAPCPRRDPRSRPRDRRRQRPARLPARAARRSRRARPSTSA